MTAPLFGNSVSPFLITTWRQENSEGTKMLNYETAGSQLAIKNADPARSTEDVVINEDWSMVMVVIAVESGIVTAKKVWDERNKIFYASLAYEGKEGVPPDDCMDVGQHVIFHRVGDFNSNGLGYPPYGFELHKEDPSCTSWICFVSGEELIFIRDVGENRGRHVRYNNGTWETVDDIARPLATLDPASTFHNGSPPYQIGRIYQGQRREDIYLIFLPGHGPLEKTMTRVINDIVATLYLDGQGNVLEFKLGSSQYY